jgi:hypothetical protein
MNSASGLKIFKYVTVNKELLIFLVFIFLAIGYWPCLNNVALLLIYESCLEWIRIQRTNAASRHAANL